jgi:hypothetical protein
MAIYIIRPPGHYGGIISGALDPKIGILPEEIAIYQRIGREWSVRKLGVVAARLWSCDLGYDENTHVDEWMAAVVSRDFDPHRELRPGDRVFQVTQEPASSLSAHLVVRDGEHFLEGRTWPLKPPRLDSLFPFLWGDHRHPAFENWPPGWDPLFVDEPMNYASEAWSLRVAPAPQFAVLDVDADHTNEFDPMGRRNVGILPTRHVHATAFTACIDVKILTWPGSKLEGVVTGLGCAYDHVRTLGDDDVPREEELLQVTAWSVDAGTTTPIGTVACRPSGYWVFEQLPDNTRMAAVAEFAICVSMPNTEISLDEFPVAGGEIIAFRRFTR